MDPEAESKPSVYEFKDLLSSSFASYLEKSRNIGDQVKQHSLMVQSAAQELLSIIALASMHSEPDQATFTAMVKPISDQIIAIQEFREKNRASPWFNHLSAISESIGSLGWIAVKPTPAPYVKEMTDAGIFYTNKVLVAYKEKDKTHVEWAKNWIAFLNEMQKYIRQHHTTGLAWNPRGNPVSRGSLANRAGAGGPPAPPPPPPASFFDDISANGADRGGGGGGGDDDTRSALLKALNKGTEITKGLKKIDPSMQTHKNPSLRSQGPIPYKAPTSVGNTAIKPVTAPSKPPKFELEGKKWMVEYQTNKKDLVVNGSEMSQSVNVFKCKDCLVMVKGKVNSITVDSCSKISLVFDDIVSVVEFVNCQNVQAQSMGCVPTINVEKTDVVEIYLNEKSLKAEIVTAKSSSVNVSVPDKTGDFVEHPIPEQFKSIWTGKGFKTEPADKAA
ncbi:adenylyl cyclase-associated protein 1 [Brevipalpus obovatus]|uniref:adenylyl cyclase-associated protein 1 n=1 Tax=Brevipalpus obovatus TaxID=246614 RepID=UPI003D9F7ADD